MDSNSYGGSYSEKFKVGQSVRIKHRAALERFAREWKLHNPLRPEQIDRAGVIAKVRDVGFYHGGDPLYELEGVPGVWHEECLEAG